MDFSKLYATLNDNGMSDWSNLLEQQISEFYSNLNHGDYPRWSSALEGLPILPVASHDFSSDSVTIGSKSECTPEQQKLIKEQLQELMPWRKGPFDLFDIDIDTEWRSNWKWDRLKDHIKPLENKMVLDIGCGNGYYGWRMLGENAKYVVGMDPTILFVMQFAAIKKYLSDANTDIIPLGIQALPAYPLNFDTVFSMGVIYHRRDPIEHLEQLRNCLKSGGELVLETLVIDSEQPEDLQPEGRYSKMNNVWSIPSCPLLIEWAKAAGFNNARVIDVTKTTIEEQRKTAWTRFESLSDFLDKDNHNKTIEGYPAPIRAIMLAERT
jgi:tRNA (mo5U34)-methyltransferase